MLKGLNVDKEMEVHRASVDNPVKAHSLVESSSSSKLASAGILAPTPRRGSIVAMAAPLSPTGSVAPMFKVLRIVGKKGAVKEVGIQGWMSVKFLKKSSASFSASQRVFVL